MSHVGKMAMPEIRDLAALKAAVARVGFEWREGQKTFKWYGTFMGDSNDWVAMFTPEEVARLKAGPRAALISAVTQKMSACHHAIRVPGAKYEIGVVDTGGGRYELRLDTYDSSLVAKLGGAAAPVLVQSYAVERVRQQARRLGHTVTEKKLPNGRVKLSIRGRG